MFLASISLSLSGAVEGKKIISLLILPRTTQDYFGLGTHMLGPQRCMWVHFVNPHRCVSGITDLWLKIVWGQQYQLCGAQLRTQWKTWQQHSRTFLAQGHRLKGKSPGFICWGSLIDRLTSQDWVSMAVIFSHYWAPSEHKGSVRGRGYNDKRHDSSLEKPYNCMLFKKNM